MHIDFGKSLILKAFFLHLTPSDYMNPKNGEAIRDEEVVSSNLVTPTIERSVYGSFLFSDDCKKELSFSVI